MKNSRVVQTYGVIVEGVPVVGFDYYPFHTVRDIVSFAERCNAIVRPGKPYEWRDPVAAWWTSQVLGGEWGRVSGNAVIFTSRERPNS